MGRPSSSQHHRPSVIHGCGLSDSCMSMGFSTSGHPKHVVLTVANWYSCAFSVCSAAFSASVCFLLPSKGV